MALVAAAHRSPSRSGVWRSAESRQRSATVMMAARVSCVGSDEDSAHSNQFFLNHLPTHMLPSVRLEGCTLVLA